MKKSILTALVLSALVSIYSGCSTVPKTTFDGNPRDNKEVATLKYNQGIVWYTYDLFVKKVNGKWGQSGWGYHSKTLLGLNLNLQLTPGKHDLEIVLGKEKRLIILTYDFKAGSSYEFLYDKNLTLIEHIDGKKVPVDFQQRDIPAYKEPAETEPHALFIIRDKEYIKTNNAGKGYLHRIDGFPGNEWSEGFVSFDYESKIRLKPGIHTLEYSFSIGSNYSTTVNTIQFNFEAGKKYTFHFEEVEKSKKDKLIGLAVIRIVELK